MMGKRTTGKARGINVSIHEPARKAAQALAGTTAYVQSQRRRQKIEMLFAHLKQQFGIRRLRLRGLQGAAEEFHLASAVQNLRRLARLTGCGLSGQTGTAAFGQRQVPWRQMIRCLAAPSPIQGFSTASIALPVLRKPAFRRLPVRPRHPGKQPRGAGAFQGSFASLVAASLPAAAQGKPIEVWFMDEARVGQQGTLTRVWAPRGTRPRAMRDHRRNSVYLFGAVCPERGMGAAVVLPHVNIEAMTIHLAEISRNVTHGAHTVLVLDQAGWHTSRKLRIPENISLLPLPPYAPELNPVEQVWAYLRANFLSHRVCNNCDAIVGACCDAWNKPMSTPERLASITRHIWARAVSG